MLLSRPQLIIFDLDGTLLDSVDSIAQSMNEALLTHGLQPHARERYFQFVGEGVRVLAERATASSDPSLIERVVTEYRKQYQQRELSALAYDGINELLQALVQRAIPLAILSNKPDVSTKRIATERFASIPFVQACGERAGVARKPDPEAALAIAKECSVAAEQCWFVGDTKVDMQTAVRANMQAVGVLWGFRGREELLANGAKVLIERPLQLLEQLSL